MGTQPTSMPSNDFPESTMPLPGGWWPCVTHEGDIATLTISSPRPTFNPINSCDFAITLCSPRSIRRAALLLPGTANRGGSLTSEGPVQVARVIPRTIAEGPGTRFAVWVQGCTIRCVGCFNPHLWGRKGGTATDPVGLATEAIDAEVEGVTLLGGEPFEQAAPLAAFARVVRHAGLSVMTFT